MGNNSSNTPIPFLGNTDTIEKIGGNTIEKAEAKMTLLQGSVRISGVRPKASIG